MTKAGRPGIMICSHSGIEVTQDEQLFLMGNITNCSNELSIEFILCVWGWCQHRGICTDQADLSSWCLQLNFQDSLKSYWRWCDGPEKAVFDGKSYAMFLLLFRDLSLQGQHTVLSEDAIGGEPCFLRSCNVHMKPFQFTANGSCLVSIINFLWLSICHILYNLCAPFECKIPLFQSFCFVQGQYMWGSDMA